MAKNKIAQGAEDQPGAPAWMMTYGDTITLLLTFFVLMMTFVGPEEENVQLIAKGFRGGGVSGAFAVSDAQRNPGNDQRRLTSAMVSEEGAEKPPMNEDQCISELSTYYPELEIGRLKEMKGARVLRVPLSTLLRSDGGLSPRGEKVLDRVVKMSKARTYRIIVRARVPGGPSGEGEGTASLQAALEVTAYLRDKAGRACEGIGVSDYVELGQPPLEEGECEIVMLEV